MSNNFQIDKYFISSYNIDSNKNLALNFICNFFQESAYRHAESHDMGYKSLIKKKHAWILSKLLIQVNQYPQWNDVINLKTWAKGTKSIFALRDFTVTGENDKVLINGTSAWILYDFNISRPKKVSEELKNFPINEVHAIDHEFNKITELTLPEQIYSYNVKYSDIDVNQHVNNAKYIEWVINSFSYDFYKNKSICEIEINFLSEALYNDRVFINHQKINDSEYLINCVKEENNKEIFRAKVCFVI